MRQKITKKVKIIIGLVIIVICILSLAHKNYLISDGTLSNTISKTINATINSFSSSIAHETKFEGGGIIGAFFISLFSALVGDIGSLIIIFAIMFAGLVLLFDVSISDIFSSIVDKFRKDEEDDEEDEYDDENSSHMEDKKVVVSSLSELTNTKEVEKQYEEALKESSRNIPTTNLYANYELPSINLLDQIKKKNQKENEIEIKKNIGILEQVLINKRSRVSDC